MFQLHKLTMSLGQTWLLVTHRALRPVPVADQRGMTLVTTMLMLVLLTFLGVAAISTTTSEMRLAGNDRSHRQAFFKAEAGIAYVVQRGISIFPFLQAPTHQPLTVLPADLPADITLASCDLDPVGSNPRRVEVLATGTAVGGGRVQVIAGIIGTSVNPVNQGGNQTNY
ncbi:MAG: hypothetical protein BWK76_14175 [Desulfobulbaceae bacterium A2]|nr:MAG: hypothetical protein BWK76_14175 [Desulfobulbaceae bacterium A2]